MKSLNRLAKLLVLAALAVYLCAPAPAVRADGAKCFKGFSCEGGGSSACDCPISNCSGCFVPNGQTGCGTCSNSALEEEE